MKTIYDIATANYETEEEMKEALSDIADIANDADNCLSDAQTAIEEVNNKIY